MVLIAFCPAPSFKLAGAVALLLGLALSFNDLTAAAKARLFVISAFVIMVICWVSDSIAGVIFGAALAIVASLFLLLK